MKHTERRPKSMRGPKGVVVPIALAALTLAGAVVLALSVHGGHGRGAKGPKAKALTVVQGDKRIPVPALTDFPKGASIRAETSSKTLVVCGAGQLFWRLAATRASAPVILIGSGAVRTIAGTFTTVAGADRAFAQMSGSRRLSCYGEDIRRFMEKQAGGLAISASQIISGGRIANFTGKSHVYLVTTSTADHSLYSYVELAVLQSARRIWIVAVSQLNAPPTNTLDTAVAALERRAHT